LSLYYYAKGHPLDVSWKREGRLKKWISFLGDIIHVKGKSPEKEAFILLLI
tara:strand:+ start:195 stop:347 length:153 start_codon:yes stop_codon:yes gene_type:complete